MTADEIDRASDALVAQAVAQGRPAKVTDPALLARVAAVLKAAAQTNARRGVGLRASAPPDAFPAADGPS